MNMVLAAPEGADHAMHPSSSWTVADGTMGAEVRPPHRGFGLFRGRSGRSDVG
jgi:hypothetical protein